MNSIVLLAGQDVCPTIEYVMAMKIVLTAVMKEIARVVLPGSSSVIMAIVLACTGSAMVMTIVAITLMR